MASTIEELWSELQNSLIGYIRSRVSNPSDAEDILQTVFLRIHAGLLGLNDTNRLRPWIYSITKNAIVDYYRGRKHHGELRDIILSEAEVPDDTLNNEVGQCLRILIEYLGAKDREALLLTEIYGYSQRELSNKLGLTYAGAKSRVQRARKRLKKLFLSCCDLQMDRCGNVVDFGRRNNEIFCPKC